MKTRIIIILVLAIQSISIFKSAGATLAETGESPISRISGKIVDKKSSQPLEYVSVAVYRTSDSTLVSGTISDTQGNFQLEKIDTGNYFLKLSFIGYEDGFSQNVEISRNSKLKDLGTIAISEVSTEINEVVVTGEARRVEYKIDKRIINVDKDLTAKGGTAVDVLENTPSVQVDPQGNLTLRGSSEYVVLIDGKPSIVKGSDALKQISSSAIKQIEVITNPSAKYDSDGKAGIINVVMKKEKMQGFNGNMNISYGNYDKETANATLNYRKNKVNLFGGFDYADNTYSNTIRIDNKTFFPDETINLGGSVYQFNQNQNKNIRGGFDFDINEKNSLSLSGNVGRQGYDNGNNSKGTNSSTSRPNTFYSKTSNYMDVTGDVAGVNFDYTHKFADNHKISFSNSYSSWTGLDDDKMSVWYTDSTFGEENLNSSLHFTKDNYNYQDRINIDYSRPLFKGTFETGVQFRYEYRNEDFVFNNYDIQTKEWIQNDTFTYELNYNNTIYSGYATYSNKVLGIAYQLGLRSEYFMRTIDISNEDGPIEYNKFMFYPSLHLSKEFNEKNSMQLSYSRRINRPQPWLLNNTPSFIDQYNIFMGSPYLIPEYTDGFELNYRTVFEKITLSAQTYYKNTTNWFTAVRLMDENGVMCHKLTNAESNQTYGAELGVDIKLFKWWQLNLNTNVYNYKVETKIASTVKEQSTNTWDARFVNNFTLKWGTKIQGVAYYRGPNVDAMGENSSYYFVNLAVSQSVLKDKVNLSLSGRNLVPCKFVYSTSTSQFDNHYNIDFEGPSFMASISYNFNNFQNKQRGRRDDLDFKGGGGF